MATSPYELPPTSASELDSMLMPPPPPLPGSSGVKRSSRRKAYSSTRPIPTLKRCETMLWETPEGAVGYSSSQESLNSLDSYGSSASLESHGSEGGWSQKTQGWRN